MISRFTFLVLFGCFLFNSLQGSFAQERTADLTEYYSSNSLPDELNRNTLEHTNAIFEHYINEFGDIEELSDDFIYEYSFYLDQINKGGYVLYDNEIASFLNEVKNEILKRNNISHPIEVYLIDYPQFNAFTNDFGSIYVTVGAIAKLESSEELLLLLAHEISHVILRHSYNSELYDQELRERQWNNSEEKNSFKRHAFSRKQELEADSLAISIAGKFLSHYDVVGLMDKLERANEPVFRGEIELDLFTFGNIELQDKLRQNWEAAFRDSIPFRVGDSNSESTHPDVSLRRKKMTNIGPLYYDSTITFEGTLSYGHYKAIAQQLLYKTYLHDESYIEALDILLKLRNKDPESEFLKSDQLQLMLLIAQEKYLDESYFVVNGFGESCQDQRFLQLKKFVYQLNPLDVNIMNHLMAKDLSSSMSISNSNYQMMYRHNSDIFELTETDGYTYAKWDSVLNIRTEELDEKEAEFSQAIADSLESYGYVLSPSSDSCLLLKTLLSEELNSQQQEWIKQEVENTRLFKGNIPWYEFNLGEFDPIRSANFYTRRNEFLYSDNYSPTAKVARVIDQSFFVKSKSIQGTRNTSFLFKFEQTFDLREGFKASGMKYMPQMDISNTSENNVSVNSNYLHRIAILWLNSLSFEDRVYSNVDEEIKTHFLDEGIDYISVILCISNRHGIFRRPFTTYYELYFDIENQGIAYISKVGSKQPLNKHQMEQFRYLSDFYKTADSKR